MLQYLYYENKVSTLLGLLLKFRIPMSAVGEPHLCANFGWEYIPFQNRHLHIRDPEQVGEFNLEWSIPCPYGVRDKNKVMWSTVPIRTAVGIREIGRNRCLILDQEMVEWRVFVNHRNGVYQSTGYVRVGACTDPEPYLKAVPSYLWLIA